MCPVRGVRRGRGPKGVEFGVYLVSDGTIGLIAARSGRRASPISPPWIFSVRPYARRRVGRAGSIDIVFGEIDR